MKSNKIAASELSDSDLPLEFAKVRKAPRWTMRQKLLGTGVVIVILGVILVPKVAPPLAGTEGGGESIVTSGPTESKAVIAALGYLEPAGGVIAVTPPRASRDANVSSLLVSIGDQVRQGDPLAVLETLSRANATLTQANAEAAVREAELARARRAVEASKAETEAKIAAVQTRLDGAALALTRGIHLAERNALTQAKLEELQTAYDALTEDLMQAKAQRVRLSGEVEDHPDVMAARATLAAAEASRQLAQTDVDEATVRAPADGNIVEIPTRLGEPAPADGLMRLAVDGPMLAILEVHQDQIQHVHLGAAVSLRSSAIMGALQGRVVQVGTEVQRQAVFASDPAANTDARVFEVRVQLDQGASKLARSLINLQVLASIESEASS